ncbi:MAG: nickel pincer cofactor biosynthesis protein LarC [Eubacteriales bacterium]|nr:nickel pincer cofactor biosynthesis protein LarC [Eubacteriales bacterium]
MDDRMLYLECYSGISGDMTVGALLDLGAREEKLREALEALGVGGYEIRIGRTEKCGIGACDFDVVLEEDGHGHGDYSHDEHVHGDHDHGDHGHAHGHNHDAHDGHSQENHEKGICALENQACVQGGHVHDKHSHGHDGHGCGEKAHDGHAHPHVHRTYKDIREILEKAPLDPTVRHLSEKIFFRVAQAEAKVHGKSLDEVHFHEVGAVDSIVDIVGAAACLVDLGIREVCVSTLYEGIGTVWCQHGRIPVPAPAVAEIVSAAGLPLRITQVQGEMVTPTGAAIAAALRTRPCLPNSFTIERIGIGAGKKDFPHANILRAMIIREERPAGLHPGESYGHMHSHMAPPPYPAPGHEAPHHPPYEHSHAAPWPCPAPLHDEITVLETNIDDCTGEQLAYTIECLMQAGARDASCLPLFMKKNRPAWMLQVLTAEEKVPAMEAIIFRETTSIGLRKYKEQRSILPRKIETIQTALGPAAIKVCEHKGQRFYYPEYASIHQICSETGKSYREIYQYLSSEAARLLEEEELHDET